MSGPRRERDRLLRSDFLRASRSGRRVDGRHFRVLIVERGDGGGTRLGITVTRKVGNAVRRNRIKRLVREWFRTQGHALGSCDLVVIAKQGLPETLSLASVREDLDAALSPARC